MRNVELTLEEGIVTVLINRPDTLNSLSSEVLVDLDTAVTTLEADPDIRGAIVTGAGRAFVAGADIEEISRLDPTSGLAFSRLGQGIFDRIERLPKPVVAALNGFALGGGCELAMACHIRLASPKAKLGQPEVKLGILPGFGGTQRLPRLVARGTAHRLLLSGAIISAAEAHRIGLVDELVDPEALLERARELLREILANGPAALAATLRAVREGLDAELPEGLALEAELFAGACGTAEMQEGTAAFLEKREPKFR